MFAAEQQRLSEQETVGSNPVLATHHYITYFVPKTMMLYKMNIIMYWGLLH